MTGRDFSYAYFVSPLRYRTPDKQCGPGRYRGLTAFASLSMAVSGYPIFYATFSLTSCSSVSDFSGFNQTSLTGSQFRVSRLQRSGFRCFADS